MMQLTHLLVAAAVGLTATPASADTICEWFGFVEDIAQAGNAAGSANAEPRPELERVRTQAALAMFEAVNAIDRRYRSYVGLQPVAPDASQKAAAVTAAARVLLARYPAQKEAIEGSLGMALSGIAEGEAKAAGIRVGEEAARSRILGGVHYRFSNEAGEEIGRRTARLALERVLQPLPASEARPAR